MRLAPLILFALAACADQADGGGGVRGEIRVVGSSTVYPFTTSVAERFVAAHPRAPSPVIESTGTGAGLRLFCAGVGADFPDIADASRRITKSEYADCAAHGAGQLMEVEIGLDGLAFARSVAGPVFALSPTLLYRALAAAPGGRPNTARTWRDLGPGLPATPIQVYGPPATSGTRDALATLILLRGCEATDPGAAALSADDQAARCTRIREDGAYIDAGENDNLIVQKLRVNPQAIGVFGYGYLRENADTVRGLPIAGVAPTYATIADGRYPGSRPLFLYVKKAHLGAVPGLRAFLRVYAADWNPDGPLVRRGLIAGSPAQRGIATQIIARETPLDPATLQ